MNQNDNIITIQEACTLLGGISESTLNSYRNYYYKDSFPKPLKSHRKNRVFFDKIELEEQLNDIKTNKGNKNEI